MKRRSLVWAWAVCSIPMSCMVGGLDDPTEGTLEPSLLPSRSITAPVEQLRPSSPGSLAIVRLSSGATVEFIESAPGLVSVSSDYLIGEPSPLADVPVKNLSLSAIFRMLAPTETVPEALLAAERRAAEASVAAPRVRPKEDQGVAELDGDRMLLMAGSSSFEANYCDTRKISHYWAAPNYWWTTDSCLVSRTNNAQKTVEGVMEAYGATCCYRGTVTFQTLNRYVGNDWSTAGTWSVQEGGCHSWITWTGNDDRTNPKLIDARLKILNAEGDGWNFAVQTGRRNCRVGCYAYSQDQCLCPN